MSKTSKSEYKNKEKDPVKGKIAYQERLIDEQIAEEEIENYVQQVVDYADFFDEISNKLK